MYDLHTHTHFSDGIYSPKEVLKMAYENGVSCLAITDHDTIEGVKEAFKIHKKERYNFKLIAGVELSVGGEECEVHLLGLNIDLENKVLNDSLTEFSLRRKNRINKIVAVLRNLGYYIEANEVFAFTQANQSLGRLHIAQTLVNKGYFPSVQEVFSKLLYKNGPAYVEHKKHNLENAINLIHDANGEAVLAHPCYIKDEAILKKAVSLGLDGIEVYYPEHTVNKVKKYLCFARDNNLKVSGGSDFHGVKGRYPYTLGVFGVAAELTDF